MISLVDYAVKLLRNHPEVSPVLCNLNLNKTENVQSKQNEDVDQEALKQLTDMGFAPERSKRALKLNNMLPLEAMDWLLAYESTSASSVPSSSVIQNHDNTDVYPKVPAIVECYRSYKRKHFKPHTKALANLKQLGFDDNEVLDALWIHSNNEVAAVG